jgi:hypothetical protein
VFWVVAGVLVLGGMVLRTLGYFELEFWMDEAMWARNFASGEPGLLRPPGYAWISTKLIELRATEPVIRSLSYAAGLVSLPLLLVTLRFAGLRRVLILFGLFILAVHPAAVTFAKEFKPYALELSLHLCLLATAFAYARSARWAPLIGLSALAAVVPLFAWSVVVLYPGLFLALAIVSLRRGDRAKLAATAVGFLVTAAVLVWMYIDIHADRSANVEFWGEKYDIFSVGDGLFARLTWYIEHTYELFGFPGHLKILWFNSAYPNPILAALMAALCIVGLVVIVARREWLWALLLVSPWLVTIGLNAFGKWPYGVFRANLFLLAYSLPLALIGLHAAGGWLAGRFEGPIVGRLRGVHIVPLFCVLAAVLCLPVRPSYFSTKPPETHAATQSTRRAMEIIAEIERSGRSPFRDRPGRDLLLLDSHAHANYTFYHAVHAETRRRLGPFLDQRLRAKKGGYSEEALETLIERESRWGFWLVVSKPSLVEPAIDAAQRFCRVDHLTELPGDNAVLRCLSKADR